MVARALYEKPPDEKELAAFGLTLSDIESEPVEVWPENERVFILFNRVSTQWRTGVNGPTGLDYNVIFHMMDRMGLAPEDYDQMESDIMEMEMEALRVMSK